MTTALTNTRTTIAQPVQRVLFLALFVFSLITLLSMDRPLMADDPVRIESHSASIENFFNTTGRTLYPDDNGGVYLSPGLNTLLAAHRIIGGNGFPLEFGYDMRATIRGTGNYGELYKLYAKIFFGPFVVEAGKDSIHYTLGKHSLLVSDNPPPVPLFLFKTARPLQFLGGWNILFFNEWLNGGGGDPSDSDTKLMGLRVAYRPLPFLEFAGTKTEHYGGVGRPGYTLLELPKMFMATSSQDFGKYDNDTLFAVETNVYLPFGKCYWEYGATDAIPVNPLKGSLSTPMIFYQPSSIVGCIIESQRSSLRMEYANISQIMYENYSYPSGGYSFQNFSLGDPLGRDGDEFFIEGATSSPVGDVLDVELLYRHAGFKRASDMTNGASETLYRGSIGIRKYLEHSLRLDLKFTYDYYRNFDTDPSPIHYAIVPGLNFRDIYFTVGLAYL